MQIVVLAFGVTVGFDSEQTPTSLTMVQGRPLVDWQLDRFAASGARSVVMCVGHLGEQVETHVKRALELGLAVNYSYAGAEPVGTGGALRRAYARLENELVLTYGDHYLPCDYSAPLRDLRAHPEALATMSVYQGQDWSGAAAVSLDGDWLAKYGKNGGERAIDGCDAGAIALRRSVLDGIEDGAVWDIEALFRRLVRQRQLRAVRVNERGYDVGSAGDREALARHLASRGHENAR
jgi:MurNAc alpha-1-phosphate uridylyltransferase